MDVEVPDLPPLPTEEYRLTVGPIDEKLWRSETGAFFVEDCPLLRSHEEMRAVQDRVLDFGCGAGRIAIQLLMQRERPSKYVGVDVNRKLIEWCRQHLTTYNSNFVFHDHDIFSPIYAPNNFRDAVAPLPAADAGFNFAIAHSVFTHLYQRQAGVTRLAL